MPTTTQVVSQPTRSALRQRLRRALAAWAGRLRAAGPRHWLLAAVLAGGAFGLSTWCLDHLVVNPTPSIPHTLLWRAGGPVARNDYVLVRVAHPYLPPGYPLVKQVRCLPGDSVRATETHLWCHGWPRGEYLDRTQDGRPLTPFRYTGRVPPGKALIFGLHPRSFDSRYLGFIELAQAERVVPLW